MDSIINVIKNKKFKIFTIKLVTKTEKDAIDTCTKILDFKDMNKDTMNKMEVGLGLSKLDVTDVFTSVIINYEFKSVKECKHFESIFSDEIRDDNSNIIEQFFIFKKRVTKKESTYHVKLNLPKCVDSIFNQDEINSIAINSYPNTKIDRELYNYNLKEVILPLDDFSSEFIGIKLTKKGNLYMIPQKWLDIEDRAKKGAYNTKWAIDIENIVDFKEGIVIACFENREIEIPKDIIKRDGEYSKFLQEGEFLVDVETQMRVPKEVVILGD